MNLSSFTVTGDSFYNYYLNERYLYSFCFSNVVNILWVEFGDLELHSIDFEYAKFYEL